MPYHLATPACASPQAFRLYQRGLYQSNLSCAVGATGGCCTADRGPGWPSATTVFWEAMEIFICTVGGTGGCCAPDRMRLRRDRGREVPAGPTGFSCCSGFLSYQPLLRDFAKLKRSNSCDFSIYLSIMNVWGITNSNL